MPVLGQPPIPHLPMPKEILDDVERMLHERSHRGFGLLDGLAGFFLRAFGHAFDLPAFARNLPVDLLCQCHDLGALLHPGVAGVGVDLLLLSMQQFCGLGDVWRQ